MKTYILDTNVYISYFTDRDLDQSAMASKYINKLENRKIKIFLPSLVIAEIIYVMIKGYKTPKANLVEALVSLVSEDGLVCENKQNLLHALNLFENKNLDFVDCYIKSLSNSSGYQLASFDKDLKVGS